MSTRALTLTSSIVTSFVTSFAVVAGSTVAPAMGTAASPPPAAAAGPGTVLVSSTASGAPADAASDRPEISGDGRFVTFDSRATNLVAGVTTPETRVYRKDLSTGGVRLISVGDDDRPAAAWSSFSWPDHTGNLVTFVSDATNLTMPRTTTRSVFVRDVAAGTTELVSISTDGRAANGASSRGMMTRDGRYVAFSSFGSNLTGTGGNGQEQVYLRDRLARTTRLVSVSASGGLGNARSYRGMVSTDGRYVAYASFATNLLGGTNPSTEAIFLRDMVGGVTRRVSIRPSGQPGGGSRPYLSADGRSIVFNSHDALVPEDTNGRNDVFLYDVATRRTERLSVSHTGGNSNSDSLRGYLTDDSRYSVFNSFSTNLVRDDTNGRGDVFLRDRSRGETVLLSRNADGGGANGQSFRPVLSGDGAVVTYLSEARNLVRGDTSSGRQVYAVRTAVAARFTADTTPPRVALTSPGRGARVRGGAVVLRGRAGDDRAVAAVVVRVRDTAARRWLGADGTWGRRPQRLAGTVTQPRTTRTSWQRRVRLPRARYRVVVRSRDAAGLRSTPARSVFRVVGRRG